MIVIGPDVHRTFAGIAIVENGSYRTGGKIGLTHIELNQYGSTLNKLARRRCQVALQAAEK